MANRGNSKGERRPPSATSRGKSGGSGKSNRSKAQRRRPREDRPYLIALFGLLVIIGAMALGPLRSLSAANDRVDELTEQRDVLAEEVDELQQQRDDLNDPAQQEVYAREQLGLIRPGEIPYVVLPDPDRPSDSADDETAGSGDAPETGAESSPWYRRLVNAMTSLFGE